MRAVFDFGRAIGSLAYNAFVKKEHEPGDAITQTYRTPDELYRDARAANLWCPHMMFAIDVSAHNRTAGMSSFGSRCLHEIGDEKNPYEQVLELLAPIIVNIGDTTTMRAMLFAELGGNLIKPLDEEGGTFDSMDAIINRYREVVPDIRIDRRISFAPVIDNAIQRVEETRQYHILVILTCGGQFGNGENIAAIRNASRYPLSIIAIGVGDEQWGGMDLLDSKIDGRVFDNFHFVSFESIKREANGRFIQRPLQDVFAVRAFSELPTQFRLIESLGLIERFGEEKTQETPRT